LASNGTPNKLSTSAAFSIVGQSLFEPISSPTIGKGAGFEAGFASATSGFALIFTSALDLDAMLRGFQVRAFIIEQHVVAFKLILTG
jgi:hypothetical protein